IFRGKIIDVTDTVYTVELTGTGDKLDAFVKAVNQADIVEVVRSGVTGIARGEKALRV
ncbi:MAG: acetolactate synthase small subunit, partial [Gammaproteobacteria bacterium]